MTQPVIGLTSDGFTASLAAMAVAPLRGPLVSSHLTIVADAVARSMAVGIAAASGPEVSVSFDTVRFLSGLGGDVTVLGRPELVATEWGAFVNAIAMSRTQSGWGRSSSCLLIASIAAAAIAVAEDIDASGVAAVEAVLVGLKVAADLARLSVGPPSRGRSPKISAISPIACAAAATRLLGLAAANEACNAIAIAAMQGAGAPSLPVSTGRAFQTGMSAAVGVEAALLALHGFTGPASAIEGRRGFAHVQGTALSPDHNANTSAGAWAIRAAQRCWTLRDDTSASEPRACSGGRLNLLSSAESTRTFMRQQATRQ